jgi:hypothetical protein
MIAGMGKFYSNAGVNMGNTHVRIDFRMTLITKMFRNNKHYYSWQVPLDDGINHIPATIKKARIVYNGTHKPKVFTDFLYKWAKKHRAELDKGSYFIDTDKLEEMMSIENYKRPENNED